MPQILYLAPLRGLTDHIYRHAFARQFGGFDAALAPFISAVGRGRKKNSSLADLDPEKNRHLPVIPQVLTKEPEEFIHLAEALHEAGHETVNWNLGCPYPMVIRKGRGSALLPHPEKIDDFLKEVVPSIKAKVSIKMRLGLESAEEILQVIPILNRHDLSEVTIHARTAEQMYEGKADHGAFARCLDQLEKPVVYNGDIATKEDYEKLSDRFPRVERWMIGRGVAADPFLGEKINGIHDPTKGDLMERVYNFHEEVFQQYKENLSGQAHLLDKMKNFWSYLGLGFINGHRVIKKIKKVGNEEHYQRVVTEIFHTGMLKGEK